MRHDHVAPPRHGVAHADDERISRHLRARLGAEGMVFHELVSDRVHVDVHLVPPTHDRPSVVLVTSGMSALPMTVPESVTDRATWEHAELCMVLPPTWRFDEAALSDERSYWPIRVLKQLARLPHEYGTWLGWGHSIPNGDPAAPYCDGTKLTGVIVIPPFALGGEFFEVPGAPPLHVFQLLPVTSAEMDFKLRHDVDALLERLEAETRDPYGAVDVARPSAV